jgi:hypothetical protein
MSNIQTFAATSIVAGVLTNWLSNYSMYSEHGFKPYDNDMSRTAAIGFKVGFAVLGGLILPAIIMVANKSDKISKLHDAAFPKPQQPTDIEAPASTAAAGGLTATDQTSLLDNTSGTPVYKPWVAVALIYFALNLVTELLPELLHGHETEKTDLVLTEIFTYFWPIHIIKAGMSFGIGSLLTNAVNRCIHKVDTGLNIGNIGAAVLLNVLIGPVLFSGINTFAPNFADLLKGGLGGDNAMGTFNAAVTTCVPIVFGCLKAVHLGNTELARRYIVPKGREGQRGFVLLGTAASMMILTNLSFMLGSHNKAFAEGMAKTMVASPDRVFGSTVALLGLWTGAAALIERCKPNAFECASTAAAPARR